MFSVLVSKASDRDLRSPARPVRLCNPDLYKASMVSELLDFIFKHEDGFQRYVDLTERSLSTSADY